MLRGEFSQLQRISKYFYSKQKPLTVQNNRNSSSNNNVAITIIAIIVVIIIIIIMKGFCLKD